MSYRQIVNSRLDEPELRAYARHRGLKPGWVWHRLQEQRLDVPQRRDGDGCQPPVIEKVAEVLSHEAATTNGEEVPHGAVARISAQQWMIAEIARTGEMPSDHAAIAAGFSRAAVHRARRAFRCNESASGHAVSRLYALCRPDEELDQEERFKAATRGVVGLEAAE